MASHLNRQLIFAPHAVDNDRFYDANREYETKANIAFLQSSGIAPAEGVKIKEYNQEIDEAMARMDAGEAIHLI